MLPEIGDVPSPGFSSGFLIIEDLKIREKN
jgi:hypothetical protein